MLWLVAGLIAVSVAGAETDGEKALKSWGEFAVGGTWTATIESDEKEHTYEWMNGRKFLKLTAKETEAPGIAIIGVDPETSEMKFWIFKEDGAFGTLIMSSPKEGVWEVKQEIRGPKGTITGKGIVTRIDNNTLKGVFENVLDGEPQPPRESTWIRK